MLPELIKIFNCVAVKSDEELLNAEIVNKLAIRCGYLVHPSACTKDVVTFLEENVANYNTTFYESWEQVSSLEEAEMKILQLLHYLSTYGTDYEGTTFTMNDFPEEMRFTEFKILLPCSERELFNRIVEMLGSGIALSNTTLDLIIEQALRYKKENGWEIDINNIKNREAKAQFYIAEDILPDDAIEMMRIFMYKVKGNALIINDKNTFNKIAMNGEKLFSTFENLNENQIEILATVFYRYKRIFLAIRNAAVENTKDNSKRVVSVINRIRKKARKFHKPFKPGILQNILSGNHSLTEIRQSLKEETSAFILIRLLNYLNTTLGHSWIRTYKIRNGKIWFSSIEENANVKLNPEFIEDIKNLVLERLSQIMKDKAYKENGEPLTVRFPRHLSLAAPVSEKMFVGAIPYGSYFRLENNNYIGIYWRNEWGTRDFDLWIVGKDGERIGWADNHKDKNLLFSGDMTNADPEATEIMYCRGVWPDCSIRVVRYNGSEGSRFRMFFGSDNFSELPANFMVNPDSIQLSEDLKSDKREMAIGIINENKVYFAAINAGDGLLPSESKEEGITIEKALAEHFSTYVSLSEILLGVGFKEYEDNVESEADIDLEKNLSKDVLINIFS